MSLAATDDVEFRARFNREAELAATLWNPPHIVSVLDRGEFNGRLWISMEYVDGTDAGRLIREHYRDGMPENDVVEIVSAVAEALDFGHERLLLHRDVKPENILVTAGNGNRRRVLLTDFGIARRIDDVSNLTDANVAMGTISYVAPEQLLGKQLSSWTAARTSTRWRRRRFICSPGRRRSRTPIAPSSSATTSARRRRGYRTAGPNSRIWTRCWRGRWPKTPTTVTPVASSSPRRCAVAPAPTVRTPNPSSVSLCRAPPATCSRAPSVATIRSGS
ncbi:hypothetical protein IWGMT90018_15870 [Mycobacterium kiyosense]|nr:hypothetical protein IWGMT90018_15870 [Mycobacterium kiyosense]